MKNFNSGQKIIKLRNNDYIIIRPEDLNKTKNIKFPTAADENPVSTQNISNSQIDNSAGVRSNWKVYRNNYDQPSFKHLKNYDEESYIKNAAEPYSEFNKDESHDEFELMDKDEWDKMVVKDDPSNPLTATNLQGVIRSVAGANLVFKKKEDNGNYTELWIYNVGKNTKEENVVRKHILGGTDINIDTQMSPDQKQKAKTYTIGNIQFLEIRGLPN